MSIMDLGSDETLPPAVVRLQNALIEFTGCIGDALPDICSVGYTLGESYVPFDPDPEDDCKAAAVQCSQAWVRSGTIQPTSGAALGWDDAACEISLTMELEVGVLRCIQLPKNGKAPKATDVLVAGMQALTDMNAILCAACGCGAWDKLSVGSWNPSGPLGGQYGGIWTFTVELA